MLSNPLTEFKSKIFTEPKEIFERNQRKSREKKRGDINAQRGVASNQKLVRKIYIFLRKMK